MKKFLLIFLLIFASSYANSQSGYGGLILDKNANLAGVRPYFNAVINERDFLGNSIYYSMLGAGMNSLGNISISVGFDVHHPLSYKSDINLVYGGSIELMGMEEVYKSFMPNVRLGVSIKKWMILGSNNWSYKKVYIYDKLGYEPQFKPSIGLFYKIN